MIRKVIFIGDYYRGNQDKNIKILFELLSPIFFELDLDIKILEGTDQYHNDNLWIESLKGIGDSALRNYNLENTAVIGFEINNLDLIYLNSKKIPWVSISIHPIRFLEDLYFSVDSSFDFDVNSLSISKKSIKLKANILKLNNLDKKSITKENSLLILGQSPVDKSVYYDNEFKSLLHYQEKLDVLSKNYHNIYYRPHPYSTDARIDKKILCRYNALVLPDENFYDMLSEEKIKGVCGISSSCLHEAEYFDKKVIFLEERKKEFSKPVNLKSLLECNDFWYKLFLSIPYSKKTVYTLEDNTCREYYGYWGYTTPSREMAKKVNDVSTYHHELDTNMFFSVLYNDILASILKIKGKYQKIVIYGYGKIGELINEQLKDSIVLRIDKEYDNRITFDISMLNEVDYDLIIISILGREKEISNHLIVDMKVKMEKIFTFEL